MTEARPHRFLVDYEDPVCARECAPIHAEIAAGNEERIDEVCTSCFTVTKVECPYGEGEHVDCALWLECDCVNPDDDPQYEAAAQFTYRFDLSKPVGDPDRYVRVWDEGSTAEGIALALAFELAMEEYDEKHQGGNYERVDPPQCWVAGFCESSEIDDALEECLGALTPGWHEAYVDNGGSIDESYLVLYLPKEKS